MKWVLHSVIFLIVAGALFSAFSGNQEEGDMSAITLLPALLLAGVYLGVMFVIYLLPALTERATNAVLASNEVVEDDPLHDARAASARGDYDEAISLYHQVAVSEPENRLPWVEIVRIQREHLKTFEAAAQTLRIALESHDWSDEDAAFFMGRLAEVYRDDLQDDAAWRRELEKITEMFPETRYAANAQHQLKQG